MAYEEKLDSDTNRVEPTFALMGLPGDHNAQHYSCFLIKREDVEEFMKVYAGYVQMPMDDWTEWDYWKR